MLQKSQGQPPFGCESKPLNHGICTTNLNWWTLDFWTINSIPRLKGKSGKIIGSYQYRLVGEPTKTWRFSFYRKLGVKNFEKVLDEVDEKVTSMLTQWFSFRATVSSSVSYWLPAFFKTKNNTPTVPSNADSKKSFLDLNFLQDD